MSGDAAGADAGGGRDMAQGLIAVPPTWRCRWCGSSPSEVVFGAPCVPKPSLRAALRDGRPGVPWLVDAGRAASRGFREVWLFDGEAIPLAPHLGGSVTVEDREESDRLWARARSAAA